MDYLESYNKIVNLPIGHTLSLLNENGIEIYVIRPDKIFKTYDINKNFQIFIKEGGREFRPNHLRVMIDLHLRVISRPDLKDKLLLAFDRIYNKENLSKAIEDIQKEKFAHSLNSLRTIAVLHQLFLIEQELNYNKPSNYDPVTLFYQGWVRQSIDGSREIDNLVMSICRFQPPAARYTSKENKKNTKFVTNLKPLWYLE